MTETKYLLFSGEDYYPGGGFEDFRGAYSSIKDAKADFHFNWHNWADICIWTGETLKRILIFTSSNAEWRTEEEMSGYQGH
jgi:hypothetical protein